MCISLYCEQANVFFLCETIYAIASVFIKLTIIIKFSFQFFLNLTFETQISLWLE